MRYKFLAEELISLKALLEHTRRYWLSRETFLFGEINKAETRATEAEAALRQLLRMSA